MSSTAETATIERTELFIGGQWVTPAGGGRIDVIDPTTEGVIGSVPEGTAEDVDHAVAAAQEAFRSVERAGA